MFQEMEGCLLFCPGSTVQETHCGGDERLACRCYATVPAVSVCVLRRSGPGREGGTLGISFVQHNAQSTWTTNDVQVGAFRDFFFPAAS